MNKKSLTILFIINFLISFYAKSQDVDIFAKIAKKDIISEIDTIIKLIEEVHPNPYCNVSKTEVIDDVNKIKANINDSINLKDYYKLIIPLLVKFKDGHIQNDFYKILDSYTNYYISNDLGIFPFLIFENKGKLILNLSLIDDISIKQGDEITHINKIEIKEIFNKCGSYVVGESEYLKLNKICTNNFFTYLLFVYDFKESFQIDYISNEDKSKKTIKVPAAKMKDIIKFKQNYRPQIKSYYSNTMVSNDENFEFSFINNKNIGYLNFYSFELLLNKEKEELLSRKIDTVFEILKSKNCGDLIIDLRNNSGGEDFCTELLLGYLTKKNVTWGFSEMKYSNYQKNVYKQFYPYKNNLFYKFSKEYREYYKPQNGEIKNVCNFDKVKYKKQKNIFNGNVYIITSYGTFSSAVTFAAICKCNKIATIVGRETGGIMKGFISALPTELTISKMKLSISSRKFKNPCSEEYQFGLTPDIEIIPTVESIVNFNDEILEKTLNIIESTKK